MSEKDVDGVFGLSFDVSSESPTSRLEKSLTSDEDNETYDVLPLGVDVSSAMPGSIVNVIPLRTNETPEVYGFCYVVERKENGEHRLSVEAYRVIAYGIRAIGVGEGGRVLTEVCGLTFDAETGISAIDEAENFVDFAESKVPTAHILELATKQALCRGEIQSRSFELSAAH